MRTRSSTRLLCSAMVTGMAACAGGDLTLPGDRSPTTLEAISGAGQEATVGSQLPRPLVARLTDGAARPVSDASLQFRFQDDVPAAKIDPATIVTTNDSGLAAVTMRLGSTAGTQIVEARLAD